MKNKQDKLLSNLLLKEVPQSLVRSPVAVAIEQADHNNELILVAGSPCAEFIRIDLADMTKANSLSTQDRAFMSLVYNSEPNVVTDEAITNETYSLIDYIIANIAENLLKAYGSQIIVDMAIEYYELILNGFDINLIAANRSSISVISEIITEVVTSLSESGSIGEYLYNRGLITPSLQGISNPNYSLVALSQELKQPQIVIEQTTIESTTDDDVSLDVSGLSQSDLVRLLETGINPQIRPSLYTSTYTLLDKKINRYDIEIADIFQENYDTIDFESVYNFAILEPMLNWLTSMAIDPAIIDILGDPIIEQINFSIDGELYKDPMLLFGSSPIPSKIFNSNQLAQLTQQSTDNKTIQAELAINSSERQKRLAEKILDKFDNSLEETLSLLETLVLDYGITLPDDKKTAIVESHKASFKDSKEITFVVNTLESLIAASSGMELVLPTSINTNSLLETLGINFAYAAAPLFKSVAEDLASFQSAEIKTSPAKVETALYSTPATQLLIEQAATRLDKQLKQHISSFDLTITIHKDKLTSLIDSIFNTINIEFDQILYMNDIYGLDSQPEKITEITTLINSAIAAVFKDLKIGMEYQYTESDMKLLLQDAINSLDIMGLPSLLEGVAGASQSALNALITPLSDFIEPVSLTITNTHLDLKKIDLQKTPLDLNSDRLYDMVDLLHISLINTALESYINDQVSSNPKFWELELSTFIDSQLIDALTAASVWLSNYELSDQQIVNASFRDELRMDVALILYWNLAHEYDFKAMGLTDNLVEFLSLLEPKIYNLSLTEKQSLLADFDDREHEFGVDLLKKSVDYSMLTFYGKDEVYLNEKGIFRWTMDESEEIPDNDQKVYLTVVVPEHLELSAIVKNEVNNHLEVITALASNEPFYTELNLDEWPASYEINPKLVDELGVLIKDYGAIVMSNSYYAVDYLEELSSKNIPNALTYLTSLGLVLTTKSEINQFLQSPPPNLTLDETISIWDNIHTLTLDSYKLMAFTESDEYFTRTFDALYPGDTEEIRISYTLEDLISLLEFGAFEITSHEYLNYIYVSAHTGDYDLAAEDLEALASILPQLNDTLSDALEMSASTGYNFLIELYEAKSVPGVEYKDITTAEDIDTYLIKQDKYDTIVSEFLLILDGNKNKYSDALYEFFTLNDWFLEKFTLFLKPFHYKEAGKPPVFGGAFKTFDQYVLDIFENDILASLKNNQATSYNSATPNFLDIKTTDDAIIFLSTDKISMISSAGIITTLRQAEESQSFYNMELDDSTLTINFFEQTVNQVIAPSYNLDLEEKFREQLESSKLGFFNVTIGETPQIPEKTYFTKNTSASEYTPLDSSLALLTLISRDFDINNDGIEDLLYTAYTRDERIFGMSFSADAGLIDYAQIPVKFSLVIDGNAIQDNNQLKSLLMDDTYDFKTTKFEWTKNPINEVFMRLNFMEVVMTEAQLDMFRSLAPLMDFTYTDKNNQEFHQGPVVHLGLISGAKTLSFKAKYAEKSQYNNEEILNGLKELIQIYYTYVADAGFLNTMYGNPLETQSVSSGQTYQFEMSAEARNSFLKAIEDMLFTIKSYIGEADSNYLMELFRSYSGVNTDSKIDYLMSPLLALNQMFSLEYRLSGQFFTKLTTPPDNSLSLIEQQYLDTIHILYDMKLLSPKELVLLNKLIYGLGDSTIESTADIINSFSEKIKTVTQENGTITVAFQDDDVIINEGSTGIDYIALDRPDKGYSDVLMSLFNAENVEHHYNFVQAMKQAAIDYSDPINNTKIEDNNIDYALKFMTYFQQNLQESSSDAYENYAGIFYTTDEFLMLTNNQDPLTGQTTPVSISSYTVESGDVKHAKPDVVEIFQSSRMQFGQYTAQANFLENTSNIFEQLDYLAINKSMTYNLLYNHELLDLASSAIEAANTPAHRDLDTLETSISDKIIASVKPEEHGTLDNIFKAKYLNNENTGQSLNEKEIKAQVKKAFDSLEMDSTQKIVEFSEQLVELFKAPQKVSFTVADINDTQYNEINQSTAYGMQRTLETRLEDSNVYTTFYEGESYIASLEHKHILEALAQAGS